LLIVIAGLSLMVSSLFAQSGSVAAHAIRVPDAAARLAADSERQQRAELGRRIQAAFERSNQVVAGLSSQAKMIRDPNAKRDLERRVAQAKFDFQIELLRVQAVFAREHGRLAHAQDLEAQVAAALARQSAKTARTAQTAQNATHPGNGGAR
jgi:stringent starvation protein B